jgi:sugar-specific transcriptional regulator TrmB
MIKQIKTALKNLGYKPNEINVYVGLTQLGESPASKIAKKIDLPRTTVISILDKLEADNLLSTHKYKGTTSYWVESPKILHQKFANKMKIAEELDTLLTDLYHSEADFPYAKIYDSKSGIRNFIEKTLIELPKKTIIQTIDAAGSGNYEKIFSNDVGKTLIELKNKKQITTHTLIPHGQLEAINKEKIEKQNIVLKEMPDNINFQASMWIINDMLVLFSGKYPFIVAIKHKIITHSMKSVYDFLWELSQKKEDHGL